MKFASTHRRKLRKGETDWTRMDLLRSRYTGPVSLRLARRPLGPDKPTGHRNAMSLPTSSPLLIFMLSLAKAEFDTILLVP
jgi:hypothetical protein